ncbi:MAG: hypothetical protein QOF19_863 [Alphaproteobacteria bacterium]|jgi:hypothetical protein|nr:hypothetical protein [Alphaproteobacteria bacterium]
MFRRIGVSARAVRLAASLLLGGALVSAPGQWNFAADLEVPRKEPPHEYAPAPVSVPVQRYGEQNPTCAKWSDGCVICTRSGCSNIGIACQPKEPACTDSVSR